MSLNPEPAAPEERAELNLAPKSYADAAEEALEPESHANGTNGTVEHTKLQLKSRVDNANAKSNGTKTPPKDHTERLEGFGQDASPKSPTVKGHHRKGSRSSHGSVGRKHGEHIGKSLETETEMFEKHPNGNGNGDALVSVKPPQELEKDRRVDLKRRNSELKSGRQAGAGWATSKYVNYDSITMAID
jgi:hypothetical protein